MTITRMEFAPDGSGVIYHVVEPGGSRFRYYSDGGASVKTCKWTGVGLDEYYSNKYRTGCNNSSQYFYDDYVYCPCCGGRIIRERKRNDVTKVELTYDSKNPLAFITIARRNKEPLSYGNIYKRRIDSWQFREIARIIIGLGRNSDKPQEENSESVGPR